MDRRILDLINDFSQWKGDSFRLAMLVSEMQKEIDREKIAAFPEAVELI